MPQFGWAEQRPARLVGRRRRCNPRRACRCRGRARSASRRSAHADRCTGRCWSTRPGGPTRETAPLWNDKRTAAIVGAFEREHGASGYLAECGNPPTPAWPGFKLMWLRDNDPEAYAAAHTVLMPKDFINFRLTGKIAMDTGDASCSFLMDPRTRRWSETMIDLLGVDRSKLPPIREPLEILGAVTAEAARGDRIDGGNAGARRRRRYPMAVLGSGVCRPASPQT